MLHKYIHEYNVLIIAWVMNVATYSTLAPLVTFIVWLITLKTKNTLKSSLISCLTTSCFQPSNAASWLLTSCRCLLVTSRFLSLWLVGSCPIRRRRVTVPARTERPCTRTDTQTAKTKVREVRGQRSLPAAGWGHRGTRCWEDSAPVTWNWRKQHEWQAQ